DQHRQGDKLHFRGMASLAWAGARSKTQPQAKHERSKQRPDEIEDRFHAHSGFYNKGVCRGDGTLVSQVAVRLDEKRARSAADGVNCHLLVCLGEQFSMGIGSVLASAMQV